MQNISNPHIPKAKPLPQKGYSLLISCMLLKIRAGVILWQSIFSLKRLYHILCFTQDKGILCFLWPWTLLKLSQTQLGPEHALRPVPFYKVCVLYMVYWLSAFIPTSSIVSYCINKSKYRILYFSDSFAARLLYMNSIHQCGGIHKIKTIFLLRFCLEQRCEVFVNFPMFNLPLWGVKRCTDGDSLVHRWCTPVAASGSPPSKLWQRQDFFGLVLWCWQSFLFSPSNNMVSTWFYEFMTLLFKHLRGFCPQHWTPTDTTLYPSWAWTIVAPR